MAQIIYQISNGSPNFTAKLISSILPDQIHTALGVYSFNNVPNGIYTLRVIDSNGCRIDIPINVDTYPCTLEGIIECYFDCTLEGTIDCNAVCVDCPEGYTGIIGGCVTEESVEATPPTDAELLANKPWKAYGKSGAKIYKLVGSEYIVDNTVPIIETDVVWKNTAMNLTDGVFNRCCVWSSLDATPNQIIGFGREIIAPIAKIYYIGVAADNYMSLEVNSILIKAFPSGDTLEDYFTSWHLFPVFLNAGSNIIHMVGYNALLLAAFGAEIYDATLEELQNTMSVEDLDILTIFSTKSLIGSYVEEGNFGIGYTCPEGYTLVNREGVFSCDRMTYIDCGASAPTTTTTTTTITS